MRRIIAVGCLIVLLGSIGVIGWLFHRSSRFDFIIIQAASRNGLDFHLVKALIYEESRFRPEIRGPAGEWGLMQITRPAAADFAVRKGFPAFYPERFLEPELNVEIGCWYLKQSLERYKNSPQPALFALLRYNAGESRADKWLQLALRSKAAADISPEDHYLSLVDFPKTRAYVQRILKRQRTRNYLF